LRVEALSLGLGLPCAGPAVVIFLIFCVEGALQRGAGDVALFVTLGFTFSTGPLLLARYLIGRRSGVTRVEAWVSAALALMGYAAATTTELAASVAAMFLLSVAGVR
jgi:hypothetical protein